MQFWASLTAYVQHMSPAWASLTAYVQHMSPAQWVGYVTMALGWVGQQFLKAPKKIDNRIAIAVMAAIGFAGYAAASPIGPDSDMAKWIEAGLMWTFGPTGVGSALSHFKLASKTDAL